MKPINEIPKTYKIKNFCGILLAISFPFFFYANKVKNENLDSNGDSEKFEVNEITHTTEQFGSFSESLLRSGFSPINLYSSERFLSTCFANSNFVICTDHGAPSYEILQSSLVANHSLGWNGYKFNLLDQYAAYSSKLDDILVIFRDGNSSEKFHEWLNQKNN